MNSNLYRNLTSPEKNDLSMKFEKLRLLQNKSLRSLNQTVSKKNESNSHLINFLGWNMERSGFSSNGVCKNSWYIKTHTHTHTKKTN